MLCGVTGSFEYHESVKTIAKTMEEWKALFAGY
jgi:hypothetical protein